MAQAAADAGVAHLVYSSVGGADRAPEVAHFVSKHEIEQRIAALGLPATVLRPVFFMDNFRWQAAGIQAGKLVQGVKPTTRLQLIAVDDIGAFAALAFGAPDEWIGRTLEIAGDELTMVEAAEVFAERSAGRWRTHPSTRTVPVEGTRRARWPRGSTSTATRPTSQRCGPSTRRSRTSGPSSPKLPGSTPERGTAGVPAVFSA